MPLPWEDTDEQGHSSRARRGRAANRLQPGRAGTGKDGATTDGRRRPAHRRDLLERGRPRQRARRRRARGAGHPSQTDAEWQAVRDAATHIVELAELLQTPGYAQERGEDWVEISQSLADVGRLAEQAAESRDPDKVFEVGGTMYNVCSA